MNQKQLTGVSVFFFVLKYIALVFKGLKFTNHFKTRIPNFQDLDLDNYCHHQTFKMLTCYLQHHLHKLEITLVQVQTLGRLQHKHVLEWTLNRCIKEYKTLFSFL